MARIGGVFGAGRRRGDGASEASAGPHGSSVARVQALFTLVLGREPEDALDLEARAARPWRHELGVLLASEEFDDAVLAALIAEQPTPQHALGAGPDPAMLAAAFAPSETPAPGQADPATQDLTVLAGPFETWRGYFSALLAPETIQTTEAFLDPARAETWRDHVAQARTVLARAPGAALVVEARFVGIDRVAARIRHFGPGPRTAQLRMLDVVSGRVLAATPVVAPQDGVVEIEAPAPTDLSALTTHGLALDVADPDGHPLGPRRRVQFGVSAEALDDALTEIAAAEASGDAVAAEALIAALLDRAPVSTPAVAAAVDGAMWRGRPDLAEARLARHAPLLASAGPASREVAVGLRLRVAAARGDRVAARAHLRELAQPSALHHALIDADDASEPSALAAALGLGEREPEALTPGLAARLSDALHAAYAPPSRIAAWLRRLSPDARTAALETWRPSDTADDGRARAGLAGAPAWSALLSYLDPSLVDPTPVDRALGAGRRAQAEGRDRAAAAWAGHALSVFEADEARVSRAHDLATAIDLAEAIAAPGPATVDLWARAADLIATLAADTRSAGAAVQLARLEARLCEVDPTRSPMRRRAAAEQARSRALEEVLSAPTAPDARMRLAEALELAGDRRSAIDILDDLCAAAPDHAAAQLRRLAVLERAERPDCVLAIAGDSDLAAGDAFETRALRSLGRVAEAAERLDDPGRGASAPLEERMRTAFHAGAFEQAAAVAAEALAARPMDRAALRIAVAAAIERGDVTAARRGLDAIAHALGASGAVETLRGADLLDPLALDARLFEATLAHDQHRSEDALAALNAMWAALGAIPIVADPTAPSRFDALRPSHAGEPDSPIGPPPLTEGPLVSVVMTAFDAAAHIETSVRSILDQRYAPLELIIVDDASRDETPELLRAMEARDPRIRLVLKTTNDGTYVSKNIGLLHAHGTYVALQDSDDWSHPDRLGKTIAALEARPERIAATSDWIRMTPDGRPVIRSSAEIAQMCRISLVFRRAPTLARIGFFDSVRIEADVEFMRRIALAFGPDALMRLRWPLLLGRAHPGSLTSDPTKGVTRAGLSTPRRAYQSASMAWHDEIAAGRSDPFVAFPQASRPFDAPETMLPAAR